MEPGGEWLAERVGFEPTWELPPIPLSRRARYDHFATSPRCNWGNSLAVGLADVNHGAAVRSARCRGAFAGKEGLEKRRGLVGQNPAGDGKPVIEPASVPLTPE